MSNNLVLPENITIPPLPPKAPELNPVENLWLFMRENWLSNRVYKSYDDVVAHCCDARSKFESQLWRIMSVGRRGGQIVLISEYARKATAFSSS